MKQRCWLLVGYKKEVFLFLFLGFLSSIPFLLVLSTLTFWLTELNVPKTTVGIGMLTTLPYSLKPLWAPYIDSFNLPILGRFLEGKYSWGVLSNLFLTISIVGLGLSNPQDNLAITFFYATLVSFSAATQDIVIDTLRIELLPTNLSGIGAAMESIGFRMGMLTSGAGALYLAEYFSWSIAYSIMACIVFCGNFIFWRLQNFSRGQKKRIDEASARILLSPIFPANSANSLVTNHSFLRLFWNSCYDIISRPSFFYILAVIFCFKIADSSFNAMSAPFVYELGFSKIEYANISKFFGTGMMIVGSLMGGYLVNRWNSVFALKSYGVLQILSGCMFIIQTYLGYNHLCLILTLGLESFVSGMGSTAFLAYLSKFCRHPFTATHFTILYSFGSLFRVLISLAAGWCAEQLGWYILFSLAAVLTLPIFFYLNKVEA